MQLPSCCDGVRVCSKKIPIWWKETMERVLPGLVRQWERSCLLSTTKSVDPVHKNIFTITFHFRTKRIDLAHLVNEHRYKSNLPLSPLNFCTVFSFYGSIYASSDSAICYHLHTNLFYSQTVPLTAGRGKSGDAKRALGPSQQNLHPSESVSDPDSQR